jgi:predicted RNA-binding Zn-ribbon protein involved in translation (DUF1610 family)
MKITIENQDFYLTDSNDDGFYDQLYNPETGIINYVLRVNGKYLLDTNNDGDWDYTYDSSRDIIEPYQEESQKEGKTILWIVILGIIIIATIIISAIALGKRRKKPIEAAPSQKLTEIMVACPSCKTIIKVKGSPGTSVPVKCPNCKKEGIAKL